MHLDLSAAFLIGQAAFESFRVAAEFDLEFSRLIANVCTLSIGTSYAPSIPDGSGPGVTNGMSRHNGVAAGNVAAEHCGQHSDRSLSNLDLARARP